MADIGNYRKEKRKMLILLCIEGLFFYGLAFFMMKDGDYAASAAMIMMPLLLVPFVQYTALSTKIEILTELQDNGINAVGVTETSHNKKLLALRFVSILITGLAMLGFVWFILHKLMTALK